MFGGGTRLTRLPAVLGDGAAGFVEQINACGVSDFYGIQCSTSLVFLEPRMSELAHVV